MTSILCDKVIAAPQYDMPRSIILSLQPLLREFQLFPSLPPQTEITLPRPELLPAMIKCLGKCSEEVRNLWLGGMASIVQSPAAAAALYTVCDKLVRVRSVVLLLIMISIMMMDR